jgi:hypothetical protein
MKKFTPFMVFSVFLLAAMIFLTNCKKDEEAPIVPAFIVTATTVQLQGGGDGLQFAAKCSNDDVKMTKVMITDPIQSAAITYNLNGTYFVKNEIFALQAQDQAYLKQIGTWTFVFVGNRTSDGTSFSSNGSLTVGK